MQDVIFLETNELSVGDKIYVSGYWFDIDGIQVFHSWHGLTLSRVSEKGNKFHKSITSPKRASHKVAMRKEVMSKDEAQEYVQQSLGELGIQVQRHADALNLPEMVEIAPTISVERATITAATRKEMLAEFGRLTEFIKRF